MPTKEDNNETSQKMSLNPNILLQGGVVEIALPVNINPFEYQKNDFTIGHTPIKMIGMSSSSFVGEVTTLSSFEQSYLRYIQNGEVLLEEPIYTPNVVSTGYKELSHCFGVDGENRIYFLDVKKNYLNSHGTTLYMTDQHFSPINQIICEKNNINSITVNKKGDIFFTCHQEQNLYKLTNRRELTTVAKGLGLPNGLTIFNDKIFIADQTGNLFEYDEKTQQTLFLTAIPENYRGYYISVSTNGDIYISTPNSAGKNEILLYTQENKILSFIETFNLLGVCGLSENGIFYWIETSRQESTLFRMNNDRKEKVLSGGFFKGFFFMADGTLFINDHHTIYKIKKEWLYEQ